MRVALVHDDLVQWGGAERVLQGLCEIYPNAPIFTSVYDSSHPELSKRFGSKKVFTSFLQKIPGWKSLYKALLPLYGVAFEQFDFSDFDLVISNTTRFAKAIITKPQTLHLCYLHTPPRFLWHLSGEKDYGILELLLTNLRIYDQISATSVDHFLAGSKNAKRRIKKIYDSNSQVVYPFIDLDRFKGVEAFDGGYLAVVARNSKYKRIDLAEAACKKVGLPLKVISGNLDDEMVVAVLAGCSALIIPGIEDFGLSSLEAQALGKPVVAFREGGAMETVIDDKTGIFFNDQTEESLIAALKKIFTKKISSEDCKENAGRFSKESFTTNFKREVDSLLYTS